MVRGWLKRRAIGDRDERKEAAHAIPFVFEHMCFKRIDSA